MGTGWRIAAVALSAALHAGLGLAAWTLAPTAEQTRATAPSGSVEVGLVYRETPAPRAPAAVGPAAVPVVRPAPRPAVKASEPAAPVGSPAPDPVPAGGEAAAAVEVEVQGSLAVAAAGEGAGAAREGGPQASGDGSAEGSVASAAAGGAGAGSGGRGEEPDVEGEMRRRLASSAARCYPKAAQRFRAEGTPRVRFCVSEDGQPRDAALVEPSGQPLLDDAALRCVLARAAPFPATTACFTVPIHFFVP